MQEFRELTGIKINCERFVFFTFSFCLNYFKNVKRLFVNLENDLKEEV